MFLDRERATPTDLRNFLGSSGLENIFNPSLVRVGGRTHLTFRAKPQGVGHKFMAYYAWQDGPGVEYKMTCLNEGLHGLGNPVVSDPKLFKVDEEVWVTFNTGSPEGANQIFIQKLAPEPGRPMACHVPGRGRLEKNWAFFRWRGLWCALYSCVPLQILIADQVQSEPGVIVFHPLDGRPLALPSKAGAIGTQLASADHEMRFIVHRKITILFWRLYFGRAATLAMEDGQWRMNIARKRLFHSLASVWGSTTKHNKHLISCTYFSGIDLDGGRVILSYGINDLDYGFAELPWVDLW